MRPAPKAYAIRSHNELLAQLAAAGRREIPPWDPTRTMPAHDDLGLQDFGRGLLDCYATALHILWVYQHAWADEKFLATAQLPDSVARLLALIGYFPRPAIAADGLQHFRLKEQTSATIPPGFAVTAPAAAGQPAATFETRRALHANSRLNELRPFVPGALPRPTTGSIADLLGAEGFGVHVPNPSDLLGSSSPADQLRARVGAAEAGTAAARAAAAARGKALQLAAVARSIAESGAEECPGAFEALCDELCAVAEQAAVAGTDTPGPLSESQELLSRQLATLRRQMPDAVDRLDGALSRGESEDDASWSARLDGMAVFLDALVTGILQEGRDQVVRLRGSRALTQLDQAFGGVRAPGSRGFAGPGTDTLYLLPDDLTSPNGPRSTPNGLRSTTASGSPNGSGRTQTALLRPGDWLVLAEELRTVAPDGGVRTRRRHAEALRLVRIDEEMPSEVGEPVTRIVFTPPLSGRYDLVDSVLIGNIVEVTHGKSARHHQRGTLAAGPTMGGTVPLPSDALSWQRDTQAANGRRAPVSVTVAGRDWAPVDDLVGADAAAQVFAVELTPEGAPLVRMGNGVEGAAVPPEAEIVVIFREGSGPDGNRDAGAVSELAAPQPVVATTSNLLPLSGGSSAEDPQAARVRGTAGIHALDRAISAADVRSLTLSYGVRRAAVLHDPMRRRSLVVVVSGDNGLPLTDDERGDLHGFLAARVPPRTTLSVTNRMVVEVRAALTVTVESGVDPLGVIAEVRRRLGVDPQSQVPGLLHPHHVQLGDDVHLSDCYGALRDVPGAVTVLISSLYRATQPPLRNDRIALADHELPLWANVPADPVDIRWEELRP